jgi:O-antigen/teichoic acid export membrane protein
MLNFQFRSTANILGYSILSAGYPAVSMRVNAVSSIISIAGSLLMIPIWGFIGSVYALLLMNTVAQIQYYIKLKKIPIKTSITKLLQPLLIMALFLMFYYLVGNESIFTKILLLVFYLLVNLLVIKDLKSTIISFIKLIPIFR